VSRSVVFVHIVVMALLAGATTAVAVSEEAPSIEILTFERFITATGPVCDRDSATVCFDLAFDYADANGDAVLELGELVDVRDALADWSLWRDEVLTVQERNGIRLGLWLVDSVGLDRLFASYDHDGDERLSADELLADVTLDRRTMAEVLLDPEAVDRRSVARRLGALAPFLDQALPD
jgi:Ca2+-binding EF-hand superfamily protein